MASIIAILILVLIFLGGALFLALLVEFGVDLLVVVAVLVFAATAVAVFFIGTGEKKNSATAPITAVVGFGLTSALLLASHPTYGAAALFILMTSNIVLGPIALLIGALSSSESLKLIGVVQIVIGSLCLGFYF